MARLHLHLSLVSCSGSYELVSSLRLFLGLDRARSEDEVQKKKRVRRKKPAWGGDGWLQYRDLRRKTVDLSLMVHRVHIFRDSFKLCDMSQQTSRIISILDDVKTNEYLPYHFLREISYPT